MSDIKKIIDEMERQKNKDRKEQSGDASYSESMRAKWFCCTFKLAFLQLISEAFFIFKLNLELALSIILKQRELDESKHVVMGCRCLKIWDLISFLICFSILVLKWRQVSPINFKFWATKKIYKHIQRSNQTWKFLQHIQPNNQIWKIKVQAEQT